MDQSEIKSSEELDSIDSLHARIAALENTVSDLQFQLQEKADELMKLKNPPLLRDDLPKEQREVLQAIIDLPDDNFADAPQLMKKLEGQPVTEVFVKSLTLVLRHKKWGVQCQTCCQPSVLLWHRNLRCKQGGSAEFSHTGTSHGGMTKICNFYFVAKPDRRRKKLPK